MSNSITTLLYFFYKCAAKFRSIFSSRITTFGYYALFSLPVLLLLSVVYLTISTFYLIGVLVAAVVVSLILSFFRRGEVKVERVLPSYAVVNEALEYKVTCTNISSVSLSSAILLDSGPEVLPTRDEFVSGVEPGEKLRNGFDRFFKYYRWMWHVKRKTKFTSKPIALPYLKKGERSDNFILCKPTRRGKLYFNNATLLLPDPIGLFQKVKKISTYEESIIVLPRRYRLSHLLLDGLSRFQLGGESASRANGQSEEMIGLREYRPGDPVKHIHWRSWAKTAKPIVKEYEDVFFPRYGLVLDTACSYSRADVFEEAVSIASSFASSIDTKECLLDLIFLNQGAKVQTVGKGIARPDVILEFLASVDIDTSPDWEGLRQKVAQHTDSLTACIVILVELDQERISLIEQLKSSGMTIMVIVLFSDSAQEGTIIAHGAIPISMKSVQRDLLGRV